MQNPKISIIIPIYNVSEYLEKNLHALFNQTLPELEYIFIDDASKDGSHEILEKIIGFYPHRASNIQVIRHKFNRGISFTRQEGLSLSTGDYIIHCDSDDWPEHNMYELLYEKAVAENADIVICDYKKITDSTEIFKQKPEELTACSVLRQFSYTNENSLIGAVWNKLIRKEIAKSSAFTEGIEYCEDVLYLMSLLKNKPKITYLDKPLYNYLTRTGSLVTRKGKDALLSDLKLFEKLKELRSETPDSNMRSAIDNFIGVTLCSRIFRYDPETEDINLLKKYQDSISYNIDKSKASIIKAKGALKINYKFFKWLNTVVPRYKKALKNFFFR